MVEFKSKIYYEEDNQIIGAEITVYSEKGDNIGSIKVTNEEDYNNLVSRIENLSEDFVHVNDLQSKIANLDINAKTLNGYSSADFAQHDHTHTNTYAPNSHVGIVADSSNMGHTKIVNNLTRDDFDGEALAAYQGKVLSEMINTLQDSLTSWTTQSVGSYGSLKVNKAFRCCRFRYVREITLNGNKVLHNNYIPSSYRPPGVVRVPQSQNTILSVDSEGDISVATTYSGSTKTTLNANFIWFY